jgi:nitrate/nitrite transporter NarK
MAFGSAWLSDWVAKRGLPRARVAAFAHAWNAAALTALAVMTNSHEQAGPLDKPSHTQLVLYVALMSALAVGFGATFGVVPTVLGDTYGLTNFGKYIGLLQLGSSAAAASTGLLTSTVVRKTGSSFAMLVALAVGVFISAIGLYFVKPTHYTPPTPTPASMSVKTRTKVTRSPSSEGSLHVQLL